MNTLTKIMSEHILGGGHWVRLSSGSYVYVEDDEEEEGDEFIFG